MVLEWLLANIYPEKLPNYMTCFRGLGFWAVAEAYTFTHVFNKMPVTEETQEKQPISWADRMEEDEAKNITPDNLPEPVETIEGDVKKILKYEVLEGKVVKITQRFKIERRSVPKGVAMRRQWKKFGDAVGDKPGPNTATTLVGEEVFLQLTDNKESLDQQASEDNTLMKLATTGKGIVQCRICKGEHWTTHCPYKDTLEPGAFQNPTDDKTSAPQTTAAPPSTTDVKPGKYIPPSKRYADDSKKSGETMSKTRDDTATVRVTNLSEDAMEPDLRELFGHFGPIQRIYLARDRITQRSKGFAFVNYYNRRDAEKAIKALDGYGYHYLILKVEWAKPQEKN